MRILVIEDSVKHNNDAHTYASQLVGCEVDFATTLEAALELLGKNQYDGAISDVFFPAKDSDTAETCDNALAISAKLNEMGIHHVFNTAGNHHGEKFQSFLWKTPKVMHHSKMVSHHQRDQQYDFLMTGMVIEAYPKEPDSEKDTKQWQAAFRYILIAHALLQLPDQGDSILGEVKVGGFPYGEYGRLTEMLKGCSHPFFTEIFNKFGT